VNTAFTSSQVAPKQASKSASADGPSTATAVGRALRVELTFDEPSGSVTGAHIGYRRKTNPDNVPALCVPCPHPTVSPAGTNPSLVSGFKGGLVDVEIDTNKNPTGDVRGPLGK
jgi:hypothetical protein